MSSKLEELEKQRSEFSQFYGDWQSRPSLDPQGTRTQLDRGEREQRKLDDHLPIYACRGNILEVIAQRQVTLIIGETGSGKSTQVVQYLLDNDPEAYIACTQPRRFAATSLAKRVNQEYCDPLNKRKKTKEAPIVGFRSGARERYPPANLSHPIFLYPDQSSFFFFLSFFLSFFIFLPDFQRENASH